MLKTAMPSKQTHPFTQANTTKGFAAHELLELLIAQAAEHGGGRWCCNPPPQRKIKNIASALHKTGLAK